MTRLKAAVVGCGHLGTIHAKLLASRDDVELVAVVDPSPEARGRVAEAHGCTPLISPLELPGRVDVAVVAAPTDLHAESSLPLIEAGIDVLIEKPIAATRLEAEVILETAKRHRRVVSVGHVERFNPAWSAASARIRRPVAVEARRRAPFTFRSLDVGAVLDLMIHDIDLVLSLDPGALVGVSACGMSATGGHEDAARAHLVFESGLVADLTASRIDAVVDRSMTIWSAGGIVSADFQSKRVETVAPSIAVEMGTFRAADAPPAERERLKQVFFEEVLPRSLDELPQGNAIASEHDDFLDAVRTRREPRVSAAAGARALDVALRIVESLAVVRFGGVGPRPIEATPAAEPTRRRAA